MLEITSKTLWKKVNLSGVLLLFGLITFSHQTVVIKIGVISTSCSRSTVAKNSSLIYQPSNIESVTVEIYWRYVDTTENFQILHAVTDLKQLNLDCIVIAASIPPNDYIKDLITVPVIDWGKDKSSNLSNQVVIPEGCPMTSTVSTTSSSACLPPAGQFIYHEPSINNNSGATLALISVITYLKWSSLCIIFDNETEQEAIRMHHHLSAMRIFAVMYRMEEMTSSKIDDLSESSVTSHESSLNCTVLCRLESCQDFLAKPFEYERKFIWRSSLRHYSRWLVGIFHDGNLSAIESKNSSVLDNIVIVQFPTTFLGHKHKNDMNFEDAVRSVFSTIQNGNTTNSNALRQSAISALMEFELEDDGTCLWLPVKALMWCKAGRALNNVGYVQLTGNLLANKDIFPNSKFGFNKRRFLVATLPWKPFVDLVNDTYSGFTIDLLYQLSQGLNFTFDLVPPVDGQWGVETNNNTWTGLIGVLQRKEVDMVAAPLSMNKDREMVMDFTHPYFYEFSSILLKKPDPNATKWRTLIDPFRPLVLLCIFISLPVSSFFLFFFEKYNPFYRKVEDRRKIRGLHHFSDSFWYMYGALLTQGGEHMADSSSGRTLLSAWWIFCIIMMATYSGNLIAFLTVTKDKLPFKDLEGLAEQTSYKYGTLGGTSYETLLKNSEVPDRRKIWSNIVEFNRTEPLVLSSNPDLQIGLVLKGKYAYIGDKTYMEQVMVNQCDLAMASSEILPLQYAIGLPNNSPFTKLFTEEITSIHESGLLQIWKARHWPKPGFCKGSLLLEPKAITLIDIQSAFYLIGIGIFIAGFSLLCEFLKQKYCKWREGRGQGKTKTETIRHVNTIPKLDDFPY